MNIEGALISTEAWLAVLAVLGLAAVIAFSRFIRAPVRPWKRKLRQSGNVFLILFGAIGIAGLIGAGAVQTMKGPTRSLSTSNHISIATNDLYTAARLVAGAITEEDDCDGDGIIEPLPWREAGALGAPENGGLIPQEVGAAKRDSWGNEVGYCAWDHGSRSVSHAVAGCGGAGANRLEGASGKTEYVIAVISAGPNGAFETICNGWVDANSDDIADDSLIEKPAGSDDIVHTETLTALFAEGAAAARSSRTFRTTRVLLPP